MNSAPTPLVIAVVGVGPRGTGVVERLLSQAALLGPSRRTVVHVVDPFPVGGGRVWRGAQPPLLWMNSTSADVTMFTDDTTAVDGPIAPGPTLAEWVLANKDTLSADPELAAELQSFSARTFASRTLQSRYLSWAFERAVTDLPESVQVHRHSAAATDLHEDESGRQILTLDDATTIEADAVVFAMGHLDSMPSPREDELAAFAGKHGLTYAPPGYTADLDPAVIPEAEPVLVSGLGLAFIDWMVLLAETRGGRFHGAEDGSLGYTPSGREPIMYVGSRRGVPYHSKISYSIADARPPLPRFFTPDKFSNDGMLDFHADVWPLASKELAGAHYYELFRSHPDRTHGTWEEFDAEFTGAEWGSERLSTLIDECIPKIDDRFDLGLINDPLAAESYSGLADVQQRVSAYVDADVKRRSDWYYSADAAVFSAFLSVYMTMGELIRRGRLPSASVARDVEGWLHSFFSFYASGPPPERLRQLVALNAAGVVQFLGPGTSFVEDPDAGVFCARSTSHPDVVTARTLIEARLPVPSIERSEQVLVRTLFERGDVSDVQASPTSAAKLSVDGRSRIVNSHGVAHPRRFAVGPWVAGHTWSPAFPRPRTNAGFFRHNDALAAELLNLE